MRLHFDKIDQATTRNIDMRGRRVINAAPSVDPTDYVIKQELDTPFIKLKKTFLNLVSYISTSQRVDYTGIDNTQIGSVYAAVADLNKLRAAYENLRLSFEDLRNKVQDSVK